MNAACLVRAVTVSCIAVCLHSLTVNARRRSSLNEATGHPSKNRQLFFVKGILDFLATLDESNIKDEVIRIVDQKIKVHLLVEGIPGERIVKNLHDLLDRVRELRSKLIQEHDNYRQFSELDPSKSSLSKYAEFVVHCLSILHSELWFLYFQTAEECRQYGGHNWGGQQIGNKVSQLHRWLTDNLDRTDVPSTLKGFHQKDLHERNNGSSIATKIGITFDHGGPLNHAQYGLFLITPIWHDANLASAILFLQEFCREVEENRKFSSYIAARKYGPLKDVCKSLYSMIRSLIDIMRPLYRESVTNNPYNAKLRSTAIGFYIDWLRKNIGHMIVSLKQMSSESKNWTRNKISNGESAGPFMYGFVFNDKHWDISLKPKFSTAISTVIEGPNTLTQLYEELKKLVPTPSTEL